MTTTKTSLVRLLQQAEVPLGFRRVHERIMSMIKTLDMIVEAIRNTKHPFRSVADRPDKPQKHRYERRKVKQYIHLGDWGNEAKP